uniref:U5 small nuclear ribonucleoprotein 40 kDa protein n=1 Tax=Caligus clemensi TaxID=344056 RepID=C1C0Y0_CALCM|nr:WD repeat-containing protein 57 [Caligus clemensi]
MIETNLKRKTDSSSPPDSAVALYKKSRQEVDVISGSSAVVSKDNGPPRCSNLEAPIMLLSGHEGEIYSAKFHPEGNVLASAGFDRQIFLWNVYGECENYGLITGHTGAILDLHFSGDGSYIYTASTDKTVGIFDSTTGQRIKRLKGHTGFVNACHPARRGPPLIVSGSDDCTVKTWDQRKRGCAHSFNNTFQVTGATYNDTADQIITGGIDNDLKIWDIRKNTTVFTLSGHTDTITGLSLSPDGSYVLTNSMDNSLRIWDVRPFVAGDRCVKIFNGHKHNFEKNLLRCSWSPDGTMIAAGSADRFVYIWDTTSRRIVFKLPGHLGSVNEVDFHKLEPIVLSASSDKNIYLGELDL